MAGSRRPELGSKASPRRTERRVQIATRNNGSYRLRLQEIDSADEWLEETNKERRTRHERYGHIAEEKVPKSQGLQEQAKALAEPLELIEEAYGVFGKNRPEKDEGDHLYSRA